VRTGLVVSDWANCTSDAARKGRMEEWEPVLVEVMIGCFVWRTLSSLSSTASTGAYFRTNEDHSGSGPLQLGEQVRRISALLMATVRARIQIVWRTEHRL
jgi:hypothetical protein